MYRKGTNVFGDQQMTLKEAQTLTLRVLKQVMEEKLDHHNVQLAQVRRATCRACLTLTVSSGLADDWFRDFGRSKAKRDH